MHRSLSLIVIARCSHRRPHKTIQLIARESALYLPLHSYAVTHILFSYTVHQVFLPCTVMCIKVRRALIWLYLTGEFLANKVQRPCVCLVIKNRNHRYRLYFTYLFCFSVHFIAYKNNDLQSSDVVISFLVKVYRYMYVINLIYVSVIH